MRQYGCHNRKPFKARVIVQTGWYADGATKTPKLEMIDNPMTKDCRYTLEVPTDPQCKGCSWRSK